MVVLTFLRAAEKHLGKRYRLASAGKIRKDGEPSVATFAPIFVEVDDFDDFAAALSEAERHPDRCLIRAAPSRWFPTNGRDVLRRKVTAEGWCNTRTGGFVPDAAGEESGLPPNVSWLAPFMEAPTSWVMVDADDVVYPGGGAWVTDPAEAAEWYRDHHLPPEFRDRSFWWQCTGSAHDPSKPDAPRDRLRLRLGFWLDRGLTQGQLEHWFRGRPVDKCTFRTVQPIYTARPKFAPGIADPVPQGCRSGIAYGLEDTVAAPDLPEAAEEDDAVRRRFDGGSDAGLLAVENFEEALDRISGDAGEVRSALSNAAAIYAAAVGVDQVDLAALVARLEEVALEHRSTAEVKGYNLASLVRWRLGTVQAPVQAVQAPVQAPVADAAEASDKLRKAVRDWVKEGLDYVPAKRGEARPVTAIRAPAGVGKTWQTLEALAEEAMGRTVWYFAPTHDLADEVAATAEGMGLPVARVYGRSYGEDPMCKIAPLAEAVALAGLPVWSSLCELKLEDGTALRCHHFETCRYVAQFEGLDGKLVVLPHEWLKLPRGRFPAPDLAVIDERFYSSVVAGGSIPLSRFVRPVPFGTFNAELRDRVVAASLKALEVGEHVRHHGVTREDLKAAADVERVVAQSETLLPGMPWSQQKRIIDDCLERKEGRMIATALSLLAEDYEREAPTERVHVVRGVAKDGELSDRVMVHWTKLRKLKAPTLLIDADADPQIVGSLMAEPKMVEIDAPIKAEVVQVTDTACSRTKMTTSKRAVERVVALARQEAATGKRVLLVGYKPMIDDLAAVPGVDFLHFGKLRGLDTFKDHDVCIVAGREQTQAVVVEGIARALFGGKGEPLLLPGKYERRRRWYRVRQGVARFGPVDVHPDPRVQAVVEQSRECETEQAVARLRPIHRTKPATFYLLSNLPTRLPVDRFVAWSEVLPDRAAAAAAEAGHVDVELLSAAELARVYPERFASVKAAKRWLERGRQKAPLSNRVYYRESGPFDPANPRFLLYRVHGLAGGRRPYRALVHGAPDKLAAEAMLAAVVGPLAVVEHGLSPDAEEAVAASALASAQ